MAVSKLSGPHMAAFRFISTEADTQIVEEGDVANKAVGYTGQHGALSPKVALATNRMTFDGLLGDTLVYAKVDCTLAQTTAEGEADVYLYKNGIQVAAGTETEADVAAPAEFSFGAELTVRNGDKLEIYVQGTTAADDIYVTEGGLTVYGITP